MNNTTSLNSPLDSPEVQSLLEYWHVHSETDAGVTRIHVPPLPRIADLHRGYWWVIYPMFVGTVSGIAVIRAALRGHSDAAYAGAFNVAVYVAITLIIVSFALHRLWRYIILEIDAREVRLLAVRRGKPLVKTRWAREQIRDIHLNRSNGKLWVSIREQDPAEVYLTSSPPVNRWIAEQVRRALHEPAAVTVNQTIHQTLAYASPLLIDETSKNQRRNQRVSIAVSLVFAIGGIALLFTPWFPLGCMSVLFAGVPAGIVLGTQKKDYYL